MLEKSNVTFQSCWRDYLFYKKEYMNIEEYKFAVQIKELSENSITICISKFDVQLKELSEDQISICRSRNYLQTKELFGDQKTICRLNNHLKIKKLSADQRVSYLQNEVQSANDLI